MGSPGVGKSRLAEEFVRSVRAEAEAEVLQGRCLPYGEGITFWPVAEIVRQAAGIADDASPDVALAGIARLVEGSEDAPVIADRLGQMVGLVDAVSAGNELFWALRRLLETLARGRPL